MRVPTEMFYSQQLNLISEGYENLNRLYMLQTNKKKLLNASDDPVLANRIQSTQNYIARLQSYQQSQLAGETRTQVFESSINQAIAAVTNVKTLLVQAGNDTISDDERYNLGEQLRGELNKLLNAANSQDTDGEYIYSGYNSGVPAFIQQGSTFTYQGGHNATTIDIGPNSSLLYNENGDDVFGNIPLGNGFFSVTAGTSNTGTASTTPGSVVNSSAYVADNYTITFVTNSAGKTGYQVIGATSGQVVPPSPATLPDDAPDYIAGNTVNFNGMSLTINGTPNVGDTFQVTSSQSQSVFNTLQNIIDVLQTPISNSGIIDQSKQALLHQNLSQTNAAFNQVMHQLTGYLSKVGVRSQALKTEQSIDGNILVNQQALLSQLADANFPELATKINQQLVSLQATQDTYMQIQKTLMSLLKI